MPIVRYAAAGGVVIDRGRMLLLDRPDRQEVRLPKGHIEPGEDPAAAALRETREESGYADLAAVRDLGCRVVEFDHAGQHYVRTEHYFLMALVSQRRSERSFQDATQFRVLWVPLDQAPDRLTFAAEQDAARRAIAAFGKENKGMEHALHPGCDL